MQMMDMVRIHAGEHFTMRVSPAQAAALRQLLVLGFGSLTFPPEVNAAIADRYGLFPERFTIDKSMDADKIEILNARGQKVGQIKSLAIPVPFQLPRS